MTATLFKAEVALDVEPRRARDVLRDRHVARLPRAGRVDVVPSRVVERLGQRRRDRDLGARVRVTSLAPWLGLSIRPVDVTDQVWVSWSRVPDQVTVPPS